MGDGILADNRNAFTGAVIANFMLQHKKQILTAQILWFVTKYLSRFYVKIQQKQNDHWNI